MSQPGPDFAWAPLQSPAFSTWCPHPACFIALLSWASCRHILQHPGLASPGSRFFKPCLSLLKLIAGELLLLTIRLGLGPPTPEDT